jgi:hypothetical protein
MGKKIAKELRNGKYRYYYGTYFGNEEGYDISIRYDYTSLLYNIYFNVSGPSNIDKLNTELAKFDKYCVAKYNNNKLIISEACDRHRDIITLSDKVIDIVIKYLKKNKYKNICGRCKEHKDTFLVEVEGSIRYACEDCFKELNKSYTKEINKKKKIKENIFLGTLGSILGCIPGLVLWIVLAYLVINPTVVGLIIMFGSAYCYKMFAKSMKIPGLIISIIIGFIFIIFANEITNDITLYNEYINQYNINIFDVYKSMPYYIKNSASIRDTYNQSLLLSFMFGAFGALTNFAVHKTFTANNKIKKLEVK